MPRFSNYPTSLPTQNAIKIIDNRKKLVGTRDVDQLLRVLLMHACNTSTREWRQEDVKDTGSLEHVAVAGRSLAFLNH